MLVDASGRAAVRIAFPRGRLTAVWMPLLFLIGLAVPPLLLLLILVESLIPDSPLALAAAGYPIPASCRSVLSAAPPRSPPL